jgi:hypothetical protein
VAPTYAHLSSEIKDLKKIYQLVKAEKMHFQGDIQNMLYSPVHEDSRQIAKRLLNTPVSFHEHVYINDTERTIISLLWHENSIDLIQKMKKKIPLYYTLLQEICFADYLDRIMFQKQLWGFNEMSFLLKTFYMNYLFHQEAPTAKVSEIRFTKVLTKYSNEYNNNGFIQKMCTELCMDKKDLFSFFLYIKNKYNEQEIIDFFETYDINKLDIFRIYRYLDKFIKEDAETIEDETIVEVYNEPCYDDGDVCFDDEI